LPTLQNKVLIHLNLKS